MRTGPRSLRLTFTPDADVPPADETLLRVDYGARTCATDAGLELALPPLGGGPFAEVWASDRIAGRGAAGRFRWVRFGERMFAWAVFDEDGDLEAASRRACAELLALARARGCPRLVRVWNHLPDLARDGRYQAFCAGRRRAMTADAAALAAPLPAATTTGSSAPGLAVLALTAARAARAGQPAADAAAGLPGGARPARAVVQPRRLARGRRRGRAVPVRHRQHRRPRHPPPGRRGGAGARGAAQPRGGGGAGAPGGARGPRAGAGPAVPESLPGGPGRPARGARGARPGAGRGRAPALPAERAVPRRAAAGTRERGARWRLSPRRPRRARSCSTGARRRATPATRCAARSTRRCRGWTLPACAAGGAGGKALPAGGFRGRRHACRAALDGPGASVPGPARSRPRALTAGRRTNWKNRAVGNSSRTDRALRANPVRRLPRIAGALLVAVRPRPPASGCNYSGKSALTPIS